MQEGVFFIIRSKIMYSCRVLGKVMPPKPEACLLERDPGPCFAALLRYAYDKTTDQCVEFAFGGCGGNGNNFETLDECEAQCMGR